MANFVGAVLGNHGDSEELVVPGGVSKILAGFSYMICFSVWIGSRNQDVSETCRFDFMNAHESPRPIGQYEIG